MVAAGRGRVRRDGVEYLQVALESHVDVDGKYILHVEIGGKRGACKIFDSEEQMTAWVEKFKRETVLKIREHKPIQEVFSTDEKPHRK